MIESLILGGCVMELTLLPELKIRAGLASDHHIKGFIGG